MRYLILLALTGCVRPEEGINDAHLVGTVRIPLRTAVDEGSNEIPDNAQDLGALKPQYLKFEGTTTAFEVDEDGLPALFADDDWVKFTVGADVTTTVTLTLGGVAEAGGGDTDTDAVETDVPDTDLPEDTDETDVPPDTDLPDTDVPPDLAVFLGLYNLDVTNERGYPTLVGSVEVFGEPGELEVTLVAGVNYAFRIGGLHGEAETPYELVFPGVDPDTLGIKAAAYLSNDTAALGMPVGGATIADFVVQDDYSYLGTYDMFGIKGVETTYDTDGTPTTTVDEDVSSVWVFAGSFGNLSGGLRAGNWYSGTPEEMNLTGEDQTVPELVLDSEAEAVIGREIPEVEPNDMPFDAAPDLALAQAIGEMSGPGYVDVISGTNDILSDVADYVHDVDAFSFTVPGEQSAFFALDWDDGAADIDVYFLDEVGDALDGAWTVAKPEYGGGNWVFEPGVTYYLVVIAYEGTPDTSPAYDLRIEWAP